MPRPGPTLVWPGLFWHRKIRPGTRTLRLEASQGDWPSWAQAEQVHLTLLTGAGGSETGDPARVLLPQWQSDGPRAVLPPRNAKGASAFSLPADVVGAEALVWARPVGAKPHFPIEADDRQGPTELQTQGQQITVASMRYFRCRDRWFSRWAYLFEDLEMSYLLLGTGAVHPDPPPHRAETGHLAWAEARLPADRTDLREAWMRGETEPLHDADIAWAGQTTSGFMRLGHPPTMLGGLWTRTGTANNWWFPRPSRMDLDQVHGLHDLIATGLVVEGLLQRLEGRRDRYSEIYAAAEHLRALLKLEKATAGCDGLGGDVNSGSA